jgi:periplasmic protein CpxP/Spy
MKRLAILALGFMLTLAASAQDQTPPQGGDRGPRQERQGNRPQMTAQARAERLAKQLELTDDQKTQVQALFEKQDAARQKKQGDGQKSREEMRAQFAEDMKTQDVEMEKIIGPEKMKKYQDARAERMKKMQERMGGDAPKPQPQN